MIVAVITDRILEAAPEAATWPRIGPTHPQPAAGRHRLRAAPEAALRARLQRRLQVERRAAHGVRARHAVAVHVEVVALELAGGRAWAGDEHVERAADRRQADVVALLHDE